MHIIHTFTYIYIHYTALLGVQDHLGLDDSRTDLLHVRHGAVPRHHLSPVWRHHTRIPVWRHISHLCDVTSWCRTTRRSGPRRWPTFRWWRHQSSVRRHISHLCDVIAHLCDITTHPCDVVQVYRDVTYLTCVTSRHGAVQRGVSVQDDGRHSAACRRQRRRRRLLHRHRPQFPHVLRHTAPAQYSAVPHWIVPHTSFVWFHPLQCQRQELGGLVQFLHEWIVPHTSFVVVIGRQILDGGPVTVRIIREGIPLSVKVRHAILSVKTELQLAWLQSSLWSDCVADITRPSSKHRPSGQYSTSMNRTSHVLRRTERRDRLWPEDHTCQLPQQSGTVTHSWYCVSPSARQMPWRWTTASTVLSWSMLPTTSRAGHQLRHNHHQKWSPQGLVYCINSTFIYPGSL